MGAGSTSGGARLSQQGVRHVVVVWLFDLKLGLLQVSEHTFMRIPQRNCQ